MQNVIILSVVILNVIILSVVILNVIILSVVMLNVVAPIIDDLIRAGIYHRGSV
jgi:hypothetical protein